MQNRKRDTDVWNSLLDSVGEGEGGMFQENSIETCVLSRVKQITSPGWMHETSALTWCTGKTQRDRVEREVGGGIGMGNTCKSMADSCQCMTKPTTIKKKKKEAGQVVWYSHLFQNLPQFVVIHTVKGFGIVNKEVDAFLELSCFFDDPTNVGNLISSSSAFSKSSLNIWKFTVHILLKPGLEDFECYFANV